MSSRLRHVPTPGERRARARVQWQERGFSDGLAARESRREQIETQHGHEAATFYSVGHRYGLRQRQREET